MNEIISGKYSKCKLEIDKERNVAYLSPNYIYIAKNNVSGIDIINSSNTTLGNPLTGAIIGGVTGAVIASSTVYEVMLEIKWRDGQSSIAKVDKETFEAITVGFHKVYSEEQFERLTKQRKEQEKRDKESLQESSSMMWLIGLGWILLLLFTRIQ